jgi:hypothetical protein
LHSTQHDEDGVQEWSIVVPPNGVLKARVDVAARTIQIDLPVDEEKSHASSLLGRSPHRSLHEFLGPSRQSCVKAATDVGQEIPVGSSSFFDWSDEESPSPIDEGVEISCAGEQTVTRVAPNHVAVVHLTTQ